MANQGQFQQASLKGPMPGTHFFRLVRTTPTNIWQDTYSQAKPTRRWIDRFSKEKKREVPIEACSTVSVFPPPLLPKRDVRPVIPTMIQQGTPTRPRQLVFGRRQVNKLPVIEETTPEQSEIILTQAEHHILQKARIKFKKNIDSFTAKNILEAARTSVRTSIAGLYYDQPTPNPQTLFWDSIEGLLTNLNAIR